VSRYPQTRRICRVKHKSRRVLGFRIFGFRVVRGSGFVRGWGLGFRVLGYRVVSGSGFVLGWGLGFRVLGL
jgi:hypothetical protein